MNHACCLLITIVAAVVATSPTAVAVQGRGMAYGGMQPGTRIPPTAPGPRPHPEIYHSIGFADGYAGKEENYPGRRVGLGPATRVDAEGYEDGYRAGKERRQVEAKAEERKVLFRLYSTEANVRHYEAGHAAGSHGRPSQPPAADEASAYIAYVEGYHRGKRGEDATPERSSRPEDAQHLAEIYVEQMQAMKQASERYYLILERANGALGLDDGTVPGPAESLARTKFAIQVAKEALDAHTQFHEHALAASRIHPRLVAALKANAASTLRGIENREIASLKRNEFANAAKLADAADRLAAEPVTVPMGFEAMGSYHRESILVMGKTLEVDRLRLTLAAGRDDPAAILVGMREYLTFCRHWQTGNLREWQESRLPRMYESVGASPPAPAGERPRDEGIFNRTKGPGAR